MHTLQETLALSPHGRRRQLAAEQAALHRTLLLLAQWRTGQSSADQALAQALDASPRSAWHRRQQQAFLDWLDGGGFTIENSGIAPLSSAPLRDSNEESKFSLVRINDAVE